MPPQIEFAHWTASELLRQSVDEVTRAGYESHIRTMQGRGLPISFEGLVQLATAQDGRKGNSLKAARSAVNWHRRCCGLQPLTHDESRRR